MQTPVVTALYDYPAKRPAELSLQKGQTFTVKLQDPSGWWTGELNGITALFPSNYVQVIGYLIHSAIAHHAFQATAANMLGFAKGDKIFILSKDPTGWWGAVSENGMRGLVPSNYLSVIAEPAQPLIAPPLPATPEIVRAERDKRKSTGISDEVKTPTLRKPVIHADPKSIFMQASGAAPDAQLSSPRRHSVHSGSSKKKSEKSKKRSQTLQRKKQKKNWRKSMPFGESISKIDTSVLSKSPRSKKSRTPRGRESNATSKTGEEEVIETSADLRNKLLGEKLDGEDDDAWDKRQKRLANHKKTLRKKKDLSSGDVPKPKKKRSTTGTVKRKKKAKKKKKHLRASIMIPSERHADSLPTTPAEREQYKQDMIASYKEQTRQQNLQSILREKEKLMESQPSTPVSSGRKSRNTVSIATLKKMREENQKKEREQMQEKEDKMRKAMQEEKQKRKQKEEEERANWSEGQRVFHEIVTTEQKYVESLFKIREVFYKPLKSKEMLDNAQLDAIFCNFESIYLMHKKLLADLELVKQGKTNFIEAFGKFVAFLRMYTIYINNYNNAISTVCDLQKSKPDFDAFLAEQFASPICNGLPFSAYLIMPIQRLGRYELLLRDYEKKTDDDEQRVKLKQMYKDVKELNVYINESKRKAEVEEQVRTLQKGLGKSINLYDSPTRKLVDSGKLGVWDLSGKGSAVNITPPPKNKISWYTFYLFNDYLLQIRENGEKVKLVRKFGLKKLLVVTTDRQDVIILTNKKTSKQYCAMSQDGGTLKKWIKAIKYWSLICKQGEGSTTLKTTEEIEKYKQQMRDKYLQSLASKEELKVRSQSVDTRGTEGVAIANDEGSSTIGVPLSVKRTSYAGETPEQIEDRIRAMLYAEET